jgi:hypothetical protein
MIQIRLYQEKIQAEMKQKEDDAIRCHADTGIEKNCQTPRLSVSLI